jgi:hypothetical protein
LRNTYDADENDEDSDDERKGKKKKLSNGPLILEQYEAQIQSVISSSLQDTAQSMIYTDDICKLIECFIGYGIC